MKRFAFHKKNIELLAKALGVSIETLFVSIPKFFEWPDSKTLDLLGFMEGKT